ncbi:YgiT-type zinc finger protein [Desulfosporosinus sp. BICA1-9]|uniref:YgiT-type zinc finger protein n=1 Tax=Desulfosporosinus sp. BICA1-9 TaxID=1531958 RepID=UPI00054B156E|nr:YgiT-type zinc finger protein [Desulfosporosinus sp. BICA1-9]KJS46187.1 MAG: hypothetical protein VR66_26760 [Peptococcaceae bacterium BRH_c23]KJS87240.1 MAG: hypothetical protein JL57_14650 [Desulfosporosinus sp. BICA1-9]
MMLKEKVPIMSMDFVHCQCGGMAEYKVGTVKQKIGSRTILIHNVPHYFCISCGSIGYDSGIKLTHILKQAYENNLSEVNYNSN